MSKFRLRLFDRVKTEDGLMHIRQFGYVRERADHPQGDSVNVIAFGGRFDDIASFVDSDKSEDVADKQPAKKQSDDVQAATA